MKYTDEYLESLDVELLKMLERLNELSASKDKMSDEEFNRELTKIRQRINEINLVLKDSREETAKMNREIMYMKRYIAEHSTGKSTMQKLSEKSTK